MGIVAIATPTMTATQGVVPSASPTFVGTQALVASATPTMSTSLLLPSASPTFVGTQALIAGAETRSPAMTSMASTYPGVLQTGTDDFTLSITVNDGGTLYTLPHSAGVEFTMAVNQTSSWSITIEDDARELHPDNPTSGWAGVLDNRAYGMAASTFSVPAGLAQRCIVPSGTQYATQITGYNTDGTPVYTAQPVLGPAPYAKTVQFNGTLGGSPFSFPVGIPNRNAARLEPGDPDDVLTYRGRGIMACAYDNEENLPYLKSQQGLHIYAQDALAFIFTYLGIPYDVSAVTNWPMARRLLATGDKAVTHIEDILAVTQAYWIETDGEVVAFQPNFSAPPSRVYDTADSNIRQLHSEEVATVVYNSVTAFRADDMGGVLATVSKSGASFGRHYSASWSTPAPSPSINVRVLSHSGGTPSDFYFYATPNPGSSLPALVLANRSPAPPVVYSPTVQSVTFTLGADANAPGDTSAANTNGSFVVQIRSSVLNVYLDDTVQVSLGASTYGRGTRHYTLGPNSMICDSTTLTNWATADLWKKSRAQVRTTWEVHFDPWLRPGMVVWFHDSQFSVVHVCFVESVTQRVKPGFAGRSTQFEAVEYVAG